ncbi:MAG: diacylglycerol kinase family protein [Bacteroidia bacterium]|nr:diacylglycerol kinase family protein [Bacteroidia bacterium]MDW8158321.1 diacylglycerol kinase family protein [Bacteroidia bacterium]
MYQFLFHRLKSFQYAFEGIKHVFRTQKNFQIHVIATLIVLSLGWNLGINTQEWAIIVLSIGWVWCLEMLNTAIELLVDIISPTYHPLAGKIKDIAAGAVLTSATAAFCIGCIIFLPYLL